MQTFSNPFKSTWIRSKIFTSIQIRSNLFKSIQVHSNPFKSTQIHNPFKSFQIYSNPIKSMQTHSKTHKSIQAWRSSPSRATRVWHILVTVGSHTLSTYVLAMLILLQLLRYMLDAPTQKNNNSNPIVSILIRSNLAKSIQINSDPIKVVEFHSDYSKPYKTIQTDSDLLKST